MLSSHVLSHRVTKMHWYERAAALLEQKGVSRAEIGRRLGITGQAVTLKLQGERPTYVPEVRVIAEFAGVSVSELLGEEAHLIEARDEIEMIEMWRLLSAEQRSQVMAIMRSLASVNRPG
jgi:transcriptional regulator with XRE-family HTH domain